MFGNVMTIIIVRRFRAASSSSAMDPYFMVLAVTDLCVVITGILPSWIHSATGFYVVSTHDVVCKSVTFLLNVGVASSAWILVAMTIQRAVSVAWPHRVSVLCTRRRVVVDHPDHRGVFLPGLFTHAVRSRHCTFRWLCLHHDITELCTLHA